MPASLVPTTLFLAALTLAACSGPPAPPPEAVALSDAFTGDFALESVDGAPVSDEDLEGAVSLVYLGFTNCPDVCPTDIGAISAALNALGAKAGEVQAVFITVDPARDDAATLKSFFSFDERIMPLTGSREALEAAWSGFKAYAKRAALTGDDYTIDHTRFYYVLDRSGRPIYALPGGGDPATLAELLRVALAEGR